MHFAEIGKLVEATPVDLILCDTSNQDTAAEVRPTRPLFE